MEPRKSIRLSKVQVIFFPWRNSNPRPQWAWSFSLWRLRDHRQTHYAR